MLKRAKIFILLFGLISNIEIQAKIKQQFSPYDQRIGKMYQQIINDVNTTLSFQELRYLNKYYFKSEFFKKYRQLIKTINHLNYQKGSLSSIKYCSELTTSKKIVERKVISWCFNHAIKRYLYKIRYHKKIKSSYFFFNTLLKHDKYLFSLFRQITGYPQKIATQQLLNHLNQHQLALPIGLKKYLYRGAILGDFIKHQEQPNFTNKNYLNYLLRKLYRNFKQANRENDFVKLQIISQQAISLFFEHKKQISDRLDYIFINIGKGFINKQYPKVAQEYFKNLLLSSKQIKIKRRNRYLFYYLWSYIRNNQYTDALGQIYKLQVLDNLEHYNAKLKFWLAYIFQKNQEKKMAHYIYKDIIKKNPLSYYAIMANQQLNYNKNSFIQQLLQLNKRSISSIRPQLPPTIKQKLRSTIFWFTVNCPKIAQYKLSKLLTILNQEGNTLSANLLKQQVMQEVVEVLRQEKQYLLLFQTIFKNTMLLSKTTLKKLVRYLFPFEYFKQIKTFSKQVNPVVILSLIRQESGFNPKAQSQPGAKGLMQLMPQTAKELNVKKISNLYIPKHNLKAGIKYFEKILKRFKGNLILALAAYNAGPSRVKSWSISHLNHPDPLVIIEDIPFKETRNYVKLIYRNIFFYNLLKEIRSTH